jgi:hypothetical protein
MSSKVVHSGIQKEVLKLYRLFMRAARQKVPEQRGPLEEMIRQKFKEKMNHPKFVVSTFGERLESGGGSRKEALVVPHFYSTVYAF